MPTRKQRTSQFKLKLKQNNNLQLSNSSNLPLSSRMTSVLIQLSSRVSLKTCAVRFLRMKAFVIRILESKTSNGNPSDSLNPWTLPQSSLLFKNLNFVWRCWWILTARRLILYLLVSEQKHWLPCSKSTSKELENVSDCKNIWISSILDLVLSWAEEVSMDKIEEEGDSLDIIIARMIY